MWSVSEDGWCQLNVGVGKGVGDGVGVREPVADGVGVGLALSDVLQVTRQRVQAAIHK